MQGKCADYKTGKYGEIIFLINWNLIIALAKQSLSCVKVVSKVMKN
jgi:hypothetical protein